MMIPTMETERLRLRGLHPDDLDEYSAMYADSEVMRHLENGVPLDRAAAWRSMAVHLGHWQLRGYGQWALVERGSQALVGRAGLWQPEGWPGLEIGWLLARPHWGRGFATEAARSALSYAFDVVGAERVISLIRPDNTPSIRVAERLGERHQRTIKLAGGAVGAVHVYAIDRHEFEAPAPIG